jgi:prevent-host-death family protein
MSSEHADFVIHPDMGFATRPTPAFFRMARQSGEMEAQRLLPQLQAALHGSQKFCSKTKFGLYSDSIPSPVETMSLSTQIKPISYLKSHAAEIVKDFATNPEPLIITQNGEAKMVVMDIAEYERQQEAFALLKLVSMGKKESAQGRVTDVDAFFAEMDQQP